jgi:hypothetical protein
MLSKNNSAIMLATAMVLIMQKSQALRLAMRAQQSGLKTDVAPAIRTEM